MNAFAEKNKLNQNEIHSFFHPSAISNIIDILDSFFTIINTAANNLSIANKKSILLIQFETLSILKAIYNASIQNNVVMLCDLIQYELKDILVKWKIKTILTLRNNLL